VKIAIIDSGLDSTHPQVVKLQESSKKWKNRRFSYYSTISQSPADQDDCGHGTHGTVLLAKIAPNAEIHCIRTVAADGIVDSENVRKGIHYAIEQEVQIISLSLGFPNEHESIKQELEDARRKKIIVFAATSNSGANQRISWPARDEAVFGVHASDHLGNTAVFGPSPTERLGNKSVFKTIGCNVLSAWPRGISVENGAPGIDTGDNGLQRRSSGTSTATPVAAGIAALVIEFAR
ncbi:subtilisin-like protein, partial [Periconia macrospinosa]